MECVKSGVGFTLLPEPDVFRMADERIRTIPLDEPGPVSTFGPCYIAPRANGTQLSNP